MDSKEAAEEFIRRESKPDFTTTEFQLELQEAEVEQEFEETGGKPEFKEVKPEFSETVAEPEFTRTITRTEFDAVHPRFRTPKKEEIEEFQRMNDYHCDQCKLYFAPTVLGLQTHFKGDMVKHQPIDECFYCNGPVYAYTLNRERQIYHNCKDGN